MKGIMAYPLAKVNGEEREFCEEVRGGRGRKSSEERKMKNAKLKFKIQKF